MSPAFQKAIKMHTPINLIVYTRRRKKIHKNASHHVFPLLILLSLISNNYALTEVDIQGHLVKSMAEAGHKRLKICVCV